MSWRRAVPLVVLAAACAPRLKGWVAFPEAEAAHVQNVHAYKGAPVCQACHVQNSAALLDGPVRTCERCHQVRHSKGHESGTPMDPKKAGGLPLPEGRVVCHTCHAEHDVRKYRHGFRAPVNEVCRACHPGF